jgi:hypothetical protein
LLEYAHGSHPGNSASLPQVTVGSTDHNGQRHLTLTCRHRLGKSGGLSYVIEFSDGLGTWANGSDQVVEASRLNPYDGTGTEIITYRSKLPLSALGSRAFLRIRCLLP